MCIVYFYILFYYFRIISEKDNLPKFENLPARTSTNKILPPTQTLPKPIITTLKNNPTMNLMDFTFKPYTKVIIILLRFLYLISLNECIY